MPYRRRCSSTTVISSPSWGMLEKPSPNGRRQGPFHKRLARILINYPKKSMQSDTWIKCTGCCLMLALLFSCVPKKRIVASGGRELKLSRGATMALMGHVAQQQLHYKIGQAA